MSASSRYEPLGLLHEDAIRRVTRARDAVTGAPVVVKAFQTRAPPERQIARMRNEYAVLEALAGVVGVPRAIDLIEDGRSVQLVLQDAGGEPLSALIGQTPMQLERFLAIAITLVETLERVHRRGFLHGDVKPSNVIVGPDRRVSLIDFELATPTAAQMVDSALPITVDGSLPYLAPERTGRMNRAVDYRADYYSLGITLYEMLTGRLPFWGGDALEWIQAHVSRSPTPIAQLAPGVPEPVADIIAILLAKLAEDRYQSATGLLADLRECQRQWSKTGTVVGFALKHADVSDRFTLSQRLYGRQGQIRRLLDAFDAVADAGSPAAVMIGGGSGSGKSRLVAELQRPIVERDGFFVSGKCDQYRGDAPLGPITAALRTLAQYVLAGGDAAIAAWRERILDAVGPLGKLVIDLIPLVERIIGPQPEVPSLPPDQAQNRAHRVFRRFIGVFCSDERPLVMFLDDLQWMDEGTSDFLRRLMTNPETHDLLLIGAFRDNELADTALPELVETLRGVGLRVDEVSVEPLSVGDVREILVDTMHELGSDAAGLADLIYRKTLGNPFFVLQFLNTLHRDGLLAFDAERLQWHWSVDAIERRGFTDNVVQLMVGELRRLPEETQRALTLAGFLGNTFSLRRLSLVTGLPPEALRNALAPALDRNLLVTRSEADVSFRFLHDRVQEAAYALTAEEQRPATHRHIGRALRAELRRSGGDALLYEVTTHLNAGRSMIGSATERHALAELNLSAAEQAKASGLYAAAAEFAAAGLEALGIEPFDTDGELAHRLTLQEAECAYLRGRHHRSNRLVDILLTHARTPLHRAEAHLIRILMLVAEGDNEAALRIGDEALRSVGLKLPPQPTDQDVARAHAEIEALLAPRGVAGILDLPRMSDPVHLVTLRLLASLSVAAVFTDQRVWALHDTQMVLLSLRHGNDDFSVMAYSFYGFLIANVEDRYADGMAFCQTAHQLMEQLEAIRFRGDEVYNTSLVTLWTAPVTEAIEMARSSVGDLIDNGNLVMASLALRFSSVWMVLRGDPLADVWAAFVETRTFAAHAYSVVDALNESSEDALLRLTGALDDRPPHADEPLADVRRQPFVRVSAMLSHLFVDVVLGDFEAAYAAVREAEPLLWVTPGLMPNYWFHYAGAIAIAARHSAADPPSAEDQARLQADLDRLAVWAANAPSSFGHAHALVSAELDRLAGHDRAAMAGYELAIELARRHGQVQHEALAAERLAAHCTELGLAAGATAYLGVAVDAYQAWGAEVKVTRLMAERPSLRAAREPATPTTSTSVAQLDALALVKAGQAISSEITRSRLVSKLIGVVLEQTTASHGALLLSDGGELRLAAVAEADQRFVSLIDADAPANRELPTAIVNFVSHSGEPVRLDDTHQPHPFTDDPYLMTVSPRSVLCLPILSQGRVMGIVYLEHRQLPDVFVATHIAIVEQLAAQAAVSLENAQLYERLAADNRDLEERVAERTAELEALHRELEAYADERYRSLVNATDDLVWTADASGKLTRAFGFERFLGADPPTSRNLAEWGTNFMHQDDYAAFLELWQDVTQRPRPVSQELRLMRTDGTMITALARTVPVFGADGQLREWVGVVNDVTETRALQEQLHQSQKMEAVGQLAGGVAHDFNNLLTVMIQSAEALRDDLVLDEFGARMVELLLGAADRAGDLTQRLLLFSRRHVIAPTVIDVDAVLRDSIAMIARLIGEDVQIVTSLEHPLPPILAGAGELDQVMLNLALNARDAMPDGGTLTFQSGLRSPAAGSARPRVVLRVSDTGTGMTRDTRDRIFEPFFTTKPVGSGTGLGLATVYGVVQRAGGEIEVESELGVGSAFTIVLPGAPEPEPQASDVHDAGDGDGHGVILVVEDEPTVRALTVETLRSRGYQVLEAADADQALALALAHDGAIDLLVTDVVLPGMTGGALADALCAQRPALRVLYTSGYNDDEVVRRGVQTATSQLLAKPYTRQMLSAAVRSILAGAGDH